MDKKKIYFAVLLLFLGASAFGLTDSLVTDRLDEQSARIDTIQTDLDYVWVILSAALVFFMQAGFMALEAGMARSKNSINVAIKNLTDFVLGVIGFWLIGFGLMFGKSHLGLFGTTDFLISIENPWMAAFFMFQAVFVGTAATIDSGAVCERAKLKQYILLSFLLTVIIYPVFGHWAWGSFLHGSDPASGGAGWLEARGFKDFAGSSVVHSVGGWMALAGIIIVGPRIGKFEIDPATGQKSNPRHFQPGDMRFVFLGVFILFFGWFGFNCGSTLAAVPDIAPIALNTTLSACFGCLVSSLLSWIAHKEHKIEGEMIANGVLGGLVAITAGCAYVDSAGAAIIGIISGVVVFGATLFIERVLKLDDVVGAVPVHGICGAWGTLAVGFFIREDMLGDMTRTGQIGIQALGVAVCFVWAFGLGLLFYFLVDRFAGGVRVDEEHELIGLNVAEHGATSSLLDLASSMDELTRTGDFEEHRGVPVDYGTEVGDLAELFNKMIGRIKSALKESRDQKNKAEELLQHSLKQQEHAEQAENALIQNQKESEEKRKDYIDQASSMVGTVVEKAFLIKDRMVKTSGVTEDMNRSFLDLSDTLNQMLSALSSVYSNVGEVDEVTREASSRAAHTRVTVGELNGITGEITQMINFINEIAQRTHLLSINTAIEAARAAEHGKGFTVISQEVQHLSHETTTAVTSIGDKVRGIEARISNVVSSMDQITGIVEKISSLNRAIVETVEQNENYTQSLEEQSRQTISVVEGVRQDVHTVVTRMEEVTAIGEDVRSSLKKME